MKELLLLPVIIVLLLFYILAPTFIIYDKIKDIYDLDPLWLYFICVIWICLNSTSLYFIL
jgi:hypothetical protein